MSNQRTLSEGPAWKDEIIATLKAKPSGSGGYKFSCASPGHPDNRPSATLNFEPNRSGSGELALVRCQRCCGNEDTLRAHGLSKSDLFEYTNASRNTEGRAYVDYVYLDPEGNLAHKSTRYYPPGGGDKKFFQARFENGNWVTGLSGCQTYLYRMDEVKSAIANGETILVLEGEQDVDEARTRGYVATTNPGGAGKWRAHYTEALRGADVVVIADNDEPGFAHAELVTQELAGVASRIRVVGALPRAGQKGDLSDFFWRSGGTTEELERLIEDTPQYIQGDLGVPEGPTAPKETTKLSDFLTEEFDDPQFLVDGLLPEGVTLLGGRAKVGKTFLLFDLAIGLDLGTRPFEDGRSGPEAEVLYIHADPVPRRVLQARTRKLLRGRTPRAFEFAFEWDRGAAGIEKLKDWIEDKRTAQPESRVLVIIDTIEHLLDRRKTGDAYQQAVASFSPWAQLAHTHDVSLILVTHTTKAEWIDPFDSIQGSVGAQGVVDTLAVFYRQTGNSDLAELRLRGREVADTTVVFRFSQERNGWAIADDVERMQASRERQLIVEAIRHFQGLAQRPAPKAIHHYMAENLGYGGTESSVKTMLRKLVSAPESGVRQDKPREGYYLAPPAGDIDSVDRVDQLAQPESTESTESTRNDGQRQLAGDRRCITGRRVRPLDSRAGPAAPETNQPTGSRANSNGHECEGGLK